MASDGKPLWATGSFWGICAAVFLRCVGAKRAAGALLLLVGGAYPVVIFTRPTDDDLRKVRRSQIAVLELDQWIGHALLGAIGWRWLR